MVIVIGVGITGTADEHVAIDGFSEDCLAAELGVTVTVVGEGGQSQSQHICLIL